MGRLEWDAMMRYLDGDVPPVDPERPLRCPLLTEDGRCSAYQVRPLVCRQWGVGEDMKCPWGCEPERYLTEEETAEMLAWSGVFADPRSFHPEVVKLLRSPQEGRDAALAEVVKKLKPDG